ncbi:M23 family metallopeptidase [Candidatus Thioglobus sp.]|uniref:murein hydrolase activator EnvC family protein n=1 Tax=Candidatus Thioglobus sp. TaxID=2026721 RepID=UPI00262FE971|nr:M23 family metallopeptidase [Candidatus Thioglobus sp.]MDG2395287.1 M23 family metallopeptidase [Candidatus Thioglobus sp.]
MQVKLLTILIISLLSGCYSQSPKPAVIVIEKSSHLENINHQRLANVIVIEHKTHKVTNQSVEKVNNKTVQKVNNKTSTWQIPVNSQVSHLFSNKHQGLTFNTNNGQKIRAIRDGKIVYIGSKMESHGKMIILRHPLGFYSTYTQTQNLQVTIGDQVAKGDVIAHTTNQPFYFEMKKFKQTINPLKYLK